MSARPLDIERRSPGTSPARGSPAPSITSQSRHSRHVSIARLGSPVPRSYLGSPPVQQIPTPTQHISDHINDIPRLDDRSPSPGPTPSALSQAIASSARQPGSFISRTPPRQASIVAFGDHDRIPSISYGSFDQRDLAGSPAPTHDPEVIRRHLVQPDPLTGRSYGYASRTNGDQSMSGLDSDEFSSLRLQGGDITRQIYRWAEEADDTVRAKAKRSQSFSYRRTEPEDETLDRQNILVPGGFRRNFIRRRHESPAPSGNGKRVASGNADTTGNNGSKNQPQLFTNNFLEFLTLYGHFAGEDLEEDDEALEPDEYFSSDAWDGYGSDDQRQPGEDSTLLTPGTPGLRRRKHKSRPPTGNNTPMSAALLLLKSFVGTGVVFLPRAFLNGGMLFSSLVLLGVAVLSYFCFILLVTTRDKVEASFGDMGGIIYGRWMRNAILFSIVLSQIGFVAAYIVFTSESLQAFVLAVSRCKSFIDIKYMVLMQLIIFLPLSLIRDISKLGFTALIADAFIMLGLLYLYYYDILTITNQGGVADVILFNPQSWTLFIGTAIFTFEGIGLIIPIQESMADPSRFPSVLGIVMLIITVLFTSIGALSYAAYGSHTKTVILLNLPQDNKLVNSIQFLYSLAILLSTPLQLFPAIRIMENSLFSRSGKCNPYIKWQKNTFRFFLVLCCAMLATVGAGDLDKFVALIGSFACVPLVAIYPPLLHLRAIAKTRVQRSLDYMVLVLGVAGCVYTTVLGLKAWVAKPAHTPHGGYCD